MSNLLRRVQFRLDHRWALGQMSAYLEGELGSRARARLERHSEVCPECRAVLLSLRRMLGLLQGLPPVSAHDVPDIASAVRRRMQGSPG